MGRRLGLMGAVLAVLLAAAIYLSIYGRPSAKVENPVKSSDIDKINKIVIQNFSGKVELGKSSAGWRVTAPYDDEVDRKAPADILEALQGFRLGSIVSENSAKWIQFGLLESASTRIQVYVGDKNILDGYIGKNVPGSFGSTYFRFAASTPVYIAENFPDYVFQRDVKAFRLSSVVPDNILEATAVKISKNGFDLDLVKSSDTWSRRSGGKTVDTKLVQDLLQASMKLRANDFAKGSETVEELGLTKPYLVFAINISSQPFSFIAGGKVKSIIPSAPANHYVKSSNRNNILVVPEALLDDLLKSAKAIPR